ncbi:hypothetical protein NFI96_006974 [Prochilodus magdalenae]|nr:hypothetical protein NFI96_006974 [Prochilodus magdalenae]
MERLVLEQLRPMVQPLLDPLQFAYQPRLGVEDAIIYLLNRVYAHLDKPASTLNRDKRTKELVVDLRRDKAQVTPISIKGVSVGHCGGTINIWVFTLTITGLGLRTLTPPLQGRAKVVLYFLMRQSRSFNICRTMLRIFYESVVASAILYAVACWGSRLRVADANRLNKLIRKASDVVGVELDSLMAVSKWRTLSKLQTIMDNGSHPLYHTVMRHRSTFSARLIQPKCTTERHRRCLKVPRSSVQTIIRKYKKDGNVQPSYRSGRKKVLCPRDERALVRSVHINPRAKAKDLVNMMAEAGFDDVKEER